MSLQFHRTQCGDSKYDIVCSERRTIVFQNWEILTKKDKVLVPRIALMVKVFYQRANLRLKIVP